ncbi:MAG: glycosyltransferase family 2 protein [Rikenellaceae bacterium]
MIDVSVIIVNYNTIDLLRDAIASVIEKTVGVNYEIIVVDNDSDDNSEIIINEEFPIVRYIKLPTNIGFGRANNEGIKIANGRNIFCLNPDTELKNNAIKILSDYIDSNAGVGMVGAQLFFRDGSYQRSYKLNRPSIGRLLKRLFFITKFEKNVETFFVPTKVAAVTGAAMMTRCEIATATGSFNPAIFMYAEDDEWCYRIEKLGYSIMFIPDAQISHYDGGSFNDSEERMARIYEGNDTYLSCMYSSFYVKCYLLLYSVLILFNLLCFKLVGNSKAQREWNSLYKYYITKELKK